MSKQPIKLTGSPRSFLDKGKISIKSHTIVKQICFPNGNVIFLSLFSLSKNWVHNLVWGWAEILPRQNLYLTSLQSRRKFGERVLSIF